jgi:outer membrane protein assembly factor BamB
MGVLTQPANAGDSLPSPTLRWTRDLGSEVKSIYSSTGPYLFVATADTLYALDKDSGSLVWRQHNRASSNFTASPFIKSNRVFIPDKTPFPSRENMSYLSKDSHGFGYTVVNSADGLPIWSTAQLGDAVALGCYISPDSSLCLFFMSDGGDSPWMSVLDLQTGRLVWERHDCPGDAKPELYRNRFGYTTVQSNPEPLYDTDSTFITFFSKNLLEKRYIHSGELVWQCKVGKKYEPTGQQHPGQMILSLDKKTLYVPCRTSLWAVRTQDGVLAWPEPIELQGEVTQVEDFAEGVLVRCRLRDHDSAARRLITLLNHETGKREWQNDFTWLHKTRVSNFVVVGDVIYVWSDDNLFRLGVIDGKSEVLTKVVIKGSGLNVLLTARDDGLLLLDAQNASLINYDGVKQFSTYHQPPHKEALEDWTQLAAVVAAVAGGGLANVSMGLPWDQSIGSSVVCGLFSSETQTFSRTHWDPEFIYMAADKIKMPSLTEQVSDSARYHWTKTKSGIVKVDLRTGQTFAALPLGDNSPMYVISPEKDLLFYIVRDNKVKNRDRCVVAAYAM